MAGNIKGITIEFRGDTTHLSNAITRIRKEGSALDSELRQIDRSLKFNPTNIDLWRQKQTVLTEKVGETKRHLEELKQAENTLRADNVDHNSAEFRTLQREIIKTENQLKRAETELRKLGNVNLTALGTQLKNTGSKLKSIGTSATTYVTTPLALAGGVAVKKFAEVDKTMKLTNSTMGNGAKEAKLLDKAMKEAAGNSTYSMDEAAKATLNFARAGLKAEEAADTLAPAMNLAAGEGGDLDTVSAGLVATLNGFGAPFSEASNYADVFANACNNSALDINSLSESMKIAAPIFKSAGYSVQDAALYMGTMANKGIPASEAANALKTGMARLVSPAKEGAQWMDKLGISVTNSDGTMKDSLTVQRELHDAFGKLSDSEKISAASAIFGKNQMSKWLALIDTSPEKVEKLNKQLGEQGTTSKMASDMMSGFGGSIEKLKSAIDVAATSLGQALAPVIGKVVEGVQWLTDKFNGMSPAGQRVVAVIGLIAAAAGPLLVVIGVLMTAIGGLMTAGPALLGAFAGVAPIVAIIAGIGIALVALWTKSKTFREAVKKGVAEIMSTLQNVWKMLKPLFAQLGSAISSLLKAVAPIAAKVIPVIVAGINLLIKTIGGFVAVLVKMVASVVQFVADITKNFNVLKNFVIGVWNAIKTAISTAINAIKNTVTSGFNAIKTAITTPITAAKTSVSNVFNSIKEKVKSAVAYIKNAADLSAVYDKLTAPFTKAWDKIKETVQKIKDKFPFHLGNLFSGFKTPHIKLKTKTKNILGYDVTYPTGFGVEWYKKGGIFDSPSVIGVGEAGSEAVVPLDTLWSKLDRIADASAGGGSVINVYASPGMDVNALAAKVDEILARQQRQRATAYGGI